MQKTLILILLCFWSLAATSQDVKIHVTGVNNAIDIYQFEPRLDRVLKRYAGETDWYWPTASLYKKYNETQEMERTQILSTIKQLEAEANNQHFKLALTNLRQQIKSWRLASKVFIPLDYDLVRLQEKFNPKLEFGEYFLNLTFRPSELKYFGVVGEGEIVHVGTEDVSHYRSTVEYNEAVDPDYVYIITPSGDVQKVVIAYWDNLHQEVAPGSMLYFPIKEAFFSEISQLNQRIAELARNRLQ
ncbi:MAG: capsule biosynthesis GfcC family protein [Aestuariibacter sp.]